MTIKPKPLLDQDHANISKGLIISPPVAQNVNQTFSTIRQGVSTNSLTKFRDVKGNTKIDAITGTATITHNDCILTIPNYKQLAGLKTSTYQLLDAITIALTESGAKSPTVIIPLSNYMERRGLKDRKAAKTQVKNDMEILRQVSNGKKNAKERSRLAGL
jgi:hypothetical protein